MNSLIQIPEYVECVLCGPSGEGSMTSRNLPFNPLPGLRCCCEGLWSELSDRDTYSLWFYRVCRFPDRAFDLWDDSERRMTIVCIRDFDRAKLGLVVVRANRRPEEHRRSRPYDFLAVGAVARSSQAIKAVVECIVLFYQTSVGTIAAST